MCEIFPDLVRQSEFIRTLLSDIDHHLALPSGLRLTTNTQVTQIRWTGR